MNAPKKSKPVVDGPIFEPFPKPQTMPEGWDFSGLTQQTNQPPSDKLDTQAES